MVTTMEISNNWSILVLVTTVEMSNNRSILVLVTITRKSWFRPGLYSRTKMKVGSFRPNPCYSGEVSERLFEFGLVTCMKVDNHSS